ncbi:efflux RND transporter periplasmic adaptor subunit [Pseudoduganella namucuonensis]|uniref:Membrane fusion protein, cobalt-zinc-cadmium efflux system n=1 Tax=Pseudoduganella namucuonensis TaxID=1035707 RepID=A0A1I7HN49_9BURK|nr:efflux RND transporter periplasmic adaptor subunit [Pseudoduganella namucuonensis]SFU62145.1 membrane fusion protein, cobalt-zinc-cadmium efflux system [Pseudoduganella namucuonensis]
MKLPIAKRHITGIAAVVLVGAIAAFALLREGGGHEEDEHGHGHAESGEHAAESAAGPGAKPAAKEVRAEDTGDQTVKGPHGGRMFTDGDFGLELKISEEGHEPEFHVYAYTGGKPLAGDLAVTVQLERLGRAPQRIEFAREQDHYKSRAIIEEPHSFKATIDAKAAGKAHRFAFEQVEARVTMDAKQLQRSGVDVHAAGPASIRTVLNLAGEVRANDERQVHVVPRLSGVAEQVRVSAGEKVAKGQVLAVLSSTGLADQRSDLLAAQRRLELARQTFERERRLWEEKISAEQDYQQARAAMQEAEITHRAARDKLASYGAAAGGGAGLTRYEIRAPIAGTVAARHVSNGEAVKEDTPIFTIVDLSEVWVEVTVPLKDLSAVKRGQRVSVRGTSFDADGKGIVSHIDAVVGEESRSARARVVLANKDGLWRPGIPVQVELVAAEEPVKVAVVNEALQELNGATVVFGRYGDAFEARPLKLGRSDGQSTEVLEGLQAGEKYAAKNSFLIKAELGKAAASHEH